MNNLVFTLVERGFLWNTIRAFFGWLDVVAFQIFSWAMEMLFDIAAVTTDSDFSPFFIDIQRRIYIIMAVFMLFKIIFSMITYLVNPDAITDKSQGAGKLVSRIILSFIMLIGFPVLFQELTNLQAHIIDNGTIQKIVMGGEAAPNMSQTATDISTSVYNGTFFTENNGGVVTYIPDEPDDIDVATLVYHVNDPVDGNRNAYKYTYMPVIGTVVGVVMFAVVLGMCIDIAIRVFKLVILQLIAPIPILSYIDPKQSKDGAFSKWVKMVFSTWAELFIKLFVIYFMILIIGRMLNGNLFNVEASPFIKILLIIGLLFFAKQAPKFICDAIGIKAPEGGVFGGIGKILAGGALLGGTVGGAIGLAKSSFDSDTAAGRNHNPLRMLKNVGAGLFGGAGGLITGGYALATSKDQNAKAVLDARNRFLSNQRSGNTLSAQLMSGAQNVFGGYNLDYEIQRANTANTAAKKLKDYAISEGSKFFNDTAQNWDIKDAAGNTIFSGNISKNDALKEIAARRLDGGDVVINGQNLGSADSDYVKALLGSIDEGIADSYMDSVDAGIHADPGALKVNRRALANAIGISDEDAANLRVTRGGTRSIKTIEKANLTRAYDLESRRGPKKS